MKKKYLLMGIIVLAMGSMLSSCYVGRYSYRPEPRYYEHSHHEHHHEHHY